jgi:hypothetical protein
MRSPDFFLDVSTTGMPTDNIPATELRRQLRAWMQRLNYNEVAASWEKGLQAVPTFGYAIPGMEFHIRPYPRRGTRGDPNERAIGVQSLEPFAGLPELPIRAAISDKAGRYGELPLPYVIAVNAMAVYAREDHAIDALFGSPAVQVSQIKRCRGSGTVAIATVRGTGQADHSTHASVQFSRPSALTLGTLDCSGRA